MTRSSVADRAEQVAAAGLCTGCGACTLLDDRLSMEPTADGFLRPRATPPAARGTRAGVRRFDRMCPGVQVVAARPAGVTRHPLLGPVRGCWEAWATDPVVRRTGSSGGVLTALQTWLVETGQVARSVGAAASSEPRRTVAVTITTREEALAAAGSRYAPVAVAALAAASMTDSSTACKPCEATALRALADDSSGPLLLSFFCAGTPSQRATERLVVDLGLPEGTPLRDLWYRGRGWPGRFTARTSEGREVSASYDESWGAALGPTVQWRCKICPDGVGESADISACDFWRADERGYPVFTETEGVSALIARTPRGLDVVLRAAEAGVIAVRPVDPDLVAAVQPLQSSRRRTLAARLVGARAAGARVPRFRGFGLLRLALTVPRESLRTARGTARRVRSSAGRRS